MWVWRWAGKLRQLATDRQWRWWLGRAASRSAPSPMLTWSTTLALSRPRPQKTEELVDHLTTVCLDNCSHWANQDRWGGAQAGGRAQPAAHLLVLLLPPGCRWLSVLRPGSVAADCAACRLLQARPGQPEHRRLPGRQGGRRAHLAGGPCHAAGQASYSCIVAPLGFPVYMRGLG